MDQACSVKMAGYWPSTVFFFCVFMDREKVEVYKNAKKERGQYSAVLTEQAWSIKDLLYGQNVTPNISFKKELNDDGGNSTDKFLKIL